MHDSSIVGFVPPVISQQSFKAELRASQIFNLVKTTQTSSAFS